MNTGANRIIVIADVDTKLSRVDVAVSPEEKSAENGLGEDIKDTVEDGFAIGGDDVSPLGQSPGNWVQEPEEDGPDAADEVGTMNFSTQSKSMSAGDEYNIVGDKEEGHHAEGEVSPLVT